MMLVEGADALVVDVLVIVVVLTLPPPLALDPWSSFTLATVVMVKPSLELDVELLEDKFEVELRSLMDLIAPADTLEALDGTSDIVDDGDVAVLRVEEM